MRGKEEFEGIPFSGLDFFQEATAAPVSGEEMATMAGPVWSHELEDDTVDREGLTWQRGGTINRLGRLAAMAGPLGPRGPWEREGSVVDFGGLT